MEAKMEIARHFLNVEMTVELASFPLSDCHICNVLHIEELRSPLLLAKIICKEQSSL